MGKYLSCLIGAIIGTGIGKIISFYLFASKIDIVDGIVNALVVSIVLYMVIYYKK